jgi:hypothetical protein
VRELVDLVTRRVDEGKDLIRYLRQPCFLAEPRSGSKGEITEPEETIARPRGMLGVGLTYEK